MSTYGKRLEEPDNVSDAYKQSMYRLFNIKKWSKLSPNDPSQSGIEIALRAYHQQYFELHENMEEELAEYLGIHRETIKKQLFRLGLPYHCKDIGGSTEQRQKTRQLRLERIGTNDSQKIVEYICQEIPSGNWTSLCELAEYIHVDFRRVRSILRQYNLTFVKKQRI